MRRATKNTYYRRIPRPRPLPPPIIPPPRPPPPIPVASGASDLGFFTVSSTLSTKLKNSPQVLETGMAAEAVADRSGSGLTDATTLQAVVLDTELHVWLGGGLWKRIMSEGNGYG